MRGVNSTSKDLLDLCFTLLDHAKIMPYYFYMCDMIPNSEHWRLAVHEAQQLQHDIMGYVPGFATPRIVCDVPFVGKRWVHQIKNYNRELGISYWTKNYRTIVEAMIRMRYLKCTNTTILFILCLKQDRHTGTNKQNWRKPGSRVKLCAFAVKIFHNTNSFQLQASDLPLTIEFGNSSTCQFNCCRRCRFRTQHFLFRLF